MSPRSLSLIIRFPSLFLFLSSLLSIYLFLFPCRSLVSAHSNSNFFVVVRTDLEKKLYLFPIVFRFFRRFVSACKALASAILFVFITRIADRHVFGRKCIVPMMIVKRLSAKHPYLDAILGAARLLYIMAQCLFCKHK